MLADRQVRLSTPSTPGHTQKKTYVFDVRHIALIEAYTQDHRLELKDVIYAICEEFFGRKHTNDVTHHRREPFTRGCELTIRKTERSVICSGQFPDSCWWRC
jgi:hypothetical protein